MPKIDLRQFDEDFESDDIHNFEKIHKVKRTEEEQKSKKKDSPKHQERIEPPDISIISVPKRPFKPKSSS